ncbi:helix-turn-helix domain-containing protein [Halostreptopolyspora alba]|uniref:XRE family transcriptional regulator n=1 Tax=Halostreptopolyspora alba TaxID=2487137 RepID=A0A3N0DYD8_9ACTN|nr:XRE family transcriptional regulator [Nocardiopsaceae bacterium YIM 96095]
MATQRKVTLRAQWLGKTFRELRERNGMTLKEVAEYLQRDISSVSRLESGVHPLRRADVIALMDLYGVEEHHQRSAMLQMGDEVSKTGWWEKHSKDVSDWVIDAVWLESRAERLRIFSIATVPGLLQTREYAEALIRAVNPYAPKQQIKRWVELRLTRQELLNKENTFNFSVVVDEAALRRPIGGGEVMAAQTQRLIADAQRDNVEIRVLPFAGGAHCSPEGAFTLITLPEPFPEVAHIESPVGALYAEATGAEELAERYDRIWTNSLDLSESLRFLSALEREWS